MDAVKQHIRASCMGTARGLDDVGYDDVLAIPTDALRHLFQLCVTDLTIPQAWLTAIIAAV